MFCELPGCLVLFGLVGKWVWPGIDIGYERIVPNIPGIGPAVLKTLRYVLYEAPKSFPLHVNCFRRMILRAAQTDICVLCLCYILLVECLCGDFAFFGWCCSMVPLVLEVQNFLVRLFSTPRCAFFLYVFVQGKCCYLELFVNSRANVVLFQELCAHVYVRNETNLNSHETEADFARCEPWLDHVVPSSWVNVHTLAAIHSSRGVEVFRWQHESNRSEISRESNARFPELCDTCFCN